MRLTIKIAENFLAPGSLPAPKNVNDMTDEEVIRLVNAFRVMATELGLDGITATSSAPMKRIDSEHFRDVFGVIHRSSDKGEPIDCVYLLVFGTPKQVRERVRETISVVAPGGGYILSSSNTIHPGVKPENYIAMVKAAREFGGYPV